MLPDVGRKLVGGVDELLQRDFVRGNAAIDWLLRLRAGCEEKRRKAAAASASTLLESAGRDIAKLL